MPVGLKDEKANLHGGAYMSKTKKRVALISAVLTLVVLALAAGFFLFPRPSEPQFSMNAAIIDQLSDELPNPTFVENATSILAASGFNVTYYNRTLDVEFFKELGKLNCGIVILRAHSALRNDSSAVDLFTSEKFQASTHRTEIESGLIVRGTLSITGPPQDYFAATYKLIETLDGDFPKSIVIAMGCWGLKPGLESTLADAFVRKGAEAFVGWTDLVGYSHTDTETTKLLERLLVLNKTIDEAVSGSLTDPTYGGKMRYYPAVSGGLRVSDLIAEATNQTRSRIGTIAPTSLGEATPSVISCLSLFPMRTWGSVGWMPVSADSKRPR